MLPPPNWDFLFLVTGNVHQNTTPLVEEIDFPRYYFSKKSSSSSCNGYYASTTSDKPRFPWTRITCADVPLLLQTRKQDNHTWSLFGPDYWHVQHDADSMYHAK